MTTFFSVGIIYTYFIDQNRFTKNKEKPQKNRLRIQNERKPSNRYQTWSNGCTKCNISFCYYFTEGHSINWDKLPFLVIKGKLSIQKSRVQKQKLIVKSPNGKNLNTAEVQIPPLYRLDVLISIRKKYIRTYSGKELLLH